MKISHKPLLIGLVVGLLTAHASAQSVNDRMRDMFGAHVNVTAPGAVEGATRGVISGGNVTIRTPITPWPAVNFDPPAVAAGCGGIDLYGGNLSFPDKEQYIQMGRAILGNIGGAAFKLALSSLCPSCDSVMGQIQDTVNALNFDSMSSCQIAEQIANGENPFKGVANAGRSIAALWKQDTGQAPDAMSANDAGPGGTSPVVAAMKDEAMAEMLQGNFVWKGLNATEAAEWLTSSREGKEELMSLIGSFIMCTPASGMECPVNSAGDDPGGYPLEAILHLHEYATLENGASEAYQVWFCPDAGECLNPRPVDRNFKKSLAAQIVDVYLGTEDRMGLLQRSVLPADEGEADGLTSLERAIVSNTQPLAARVFECSRQGAPGMGHARLIVEGLAPQIAAELLHTTTIQVVRELRKYVQANNTKVGADKALEVLQEAQARLDRDLIDIQKKADMTDTLRIALDRCMPYAMSTHVVANH